MAEAVAWAVAEVGAAIGGEIGATAIMYSTEIATAVTAVATVSAIRMQQIKAQQAARAAWAAAQKDRYVMTRGALQPRQVVLGRLRSSGPMFYVGSYGDDAEHLVFALALAGHEIDAVEALYLDDEPIVMDGGGNFIGILRTEQFSISGPSDVFTIGGAAKSGTVAAVAEYGSDTVTLTATVDDQDVTVSGARTGEVGRVLITYQPSPCPFKPSQTVLGSVSTLLDALPKTITLPVDPLSGSVAAVQHLPGDGGDQACDITISGRGVTITTGTLGEQTVVSYTSSISTSLARARVYLGRRDQAADPGLLAAFPDHWTASHRAAGVAYLVVELDYDRDAFSGGVPNISARIRGAKCHDPRRNKMPNWLGTGAVAGNPGALPTGWAKSVPAGLSLSVQAVGTDEATGLPFVAFRAVGTPTAASQLAIVPVPYAVAPAASAGQAWSVQASVRRLAGSPWSTWGNARLQVYSYNAAGAGTLEAAVSITAAQVDGPQDPITVADAAASSGTTRMGLRLLFDVTAGVPVDQTFAILLPQLWQGTAAPTAWTENTALQAAHYATHPIGGRLPCSQVDMAALASAATVCDTSTTYTLGSADFVRPLYRSAYSALTTTKPTEVLSDLCLAMGGEWAYINGQLRLKAGAWRAPVLTLDESWLQGDQPVQIQAALDRDDLVNSIRGTYYDERRQWRQTDIPAQAPDTYLQLDRLRLPLTVDYAAVTFGGQAQYLAACTLRAARQGMVLRLACNLRAWQAEAFDNLAVSLERFGFAGKVFEVRSTSWTLEGGVELVLRETDASTWDMDAGFPAEDPAPNTRLPDPWAVPPITGLACASGADWLLTQADGTIVSRIHATWDDVTDPRITEEGGHVELRWGLATQDVALYQTTRITGTDEQAYLTGVQDERIYLVQARAVGAVGHSDWCAPVLVTARGKSTAADNVLALAAGIVYGAVQVTWQPSFESDYAYTELRLGTVWATATPLVGSQPTRITGSSYAWAWPAYGSYTVLAKHVDASGNQSATPASVAVVVDDAINLGNGAWTLKAGPGMTVQGGRATKTGTTSAWDAQAYSAQGYTGGAAMTVAPLQTAGRFMAGLNGDPATSAHYNTIDFAFYADTAGALRIYEDGGLVGTFGAYAAGDVLGVQYDNAAITYTRNGSPLRTVPSVGAGRTFWVDSSFYDPGAAAAFTFAPAGAVGADGADGASAPLLSLKCTAQSFTFDGAGAASPTSQTITASAVLQNVSGTATWVCTRYNSAGASLGTVTMGGSGNTRTLTVAQFGVAAYAVITATLGSLSDTETWVRVSDGAGNIVSDLSNQNATFPADAAGNVLDYANGVSTLTIWNGLANDTANWTVAATTSSGVTATLSGATVTVAGFSAALNSGYVDISATRTGYTAIPAKRFTLSKSKPGGSEGPIASLVTTYSTHFINSGTATASVLYNTDGTITGTHIENPSVWYAPATGTPGTGYWVKFKKISGDAPTGGSALDTWLQLNTARGPSLSTSAFGVKRCTLQVMIAADSAGALIVATGQAILEVEYA